MRIAVKVVVGVVLVVTIGIVFACARGPVGPESVVGKDVADYVERAARNANAVMLQSESSDPGSLTLPFGLELKRRVKRTLEASGLVFPARETATQFTLQDRQRSH